jgi:hypothetical protein
MSEPAPEDLIEEFKEWQARTRVRARITLVCFGALGLLALGLLLRGEDTRSDAGKTQAGVDRATRTIGKVDANSRELAALTRRVDRALQELRGQFLALLELLDGAGIVETSAIEGNADATELPQPQSAPGPDQPDDSGGPAPGDGGNGGDPPGGPGPEPDPPSNPPPGPGPEPRDPSVGGLGADVPILDECQLVPIACS